MEKENNLLRGLQEAAEAKTVRDREQEKPENLKRTVDAIKKVMKELGIGDSDWDYNVIEKRNYVELILGNISQEEVITCNNSNQELSKTISELRKKLNNTPSPVHIKGGFLSEDWSFGGAKKAIEEVITDDKIPAKVKIEFARLVDDNDKEKIRVSQIIIEHNLGDYELEYFIKEIKVRMSILNGSVLLMIVGPFLTYEKVDT